MRHPAEIECAERAETVDRSTPEGEGVFDALTARSVKLADRDPSYQSGYRRGASERRAIWHRHSRELDERRNRRYSWSH